ncbi:MAG: DMT family transporter [Treponema sp.]|nr:DMT family transporter [Treponema sp.]
MKKVEGSFAMVLCALGWSLGGVFLKYVTINSFVIAGFRSLIAFATIAIFSRSLPHFFVRSEQDNSIDKKQTLYLWLSAISYAGTMILYVISNKLTYAANVVFLEYTEPVWVILFSTLLIGERNKKIDYVTFAGIVVGMILFFADNLLESRAGTQTSEFADTALLGNILALCSGITFAATTIFQRKQQLLIAQVKQAEGQKQISTEDKHFGDEEKESDADSAVFSDTKENNKARPATRKKQNTSRDAFMLAQLIVANFGLSFVFLKENGIPDIKSLTFLLLLGMFQMGIPNILYSIGIKKVTALSASLITMIEPLMNPVWVFIFVHELPGWKCLLGGAIILAFILIREIVMKRKK